MIHRASLILILTFALIPSGLRSQVPDTLRAAMSRTGVFPGGEAGLRVVPESEVFLEAFRSILDYHQITFSDSTLWELALKGLIQGINDPYAEVFTPEAYGVFE